MESAMNDLVGRTLGQYRIIEQLGKGGMATVYRAFQPSLERYVAVKVLMPYFAHEEGFSERFVREAKAIARLDHPHILPIYDYGHEGEIHYIVIKCVDTGTLQDLEAGKPVPLDRSVRIVSQIADALDHAHRHGVIHRDVKPANVLLDQDEWVFLSDFGLARMVEGSQQLTISGVGVGTPAYMSPEQCQAKAIDRRADIYSLGIVLYEMLTGCVPYEAETPLAVVLKHITEPLPMPRTINPAIPETVELVILKALAKEPGDRYQTAGEMAAALCNAVECAEITAVSDAPGLEPISPAVTPESIVQEEKAIGAIETSALAAESTTRARPVPPGRRVAWWVYVAALLVGLALVAGGVWLGSGGWSRLAGRAGAPPGPGEQTPVPTPTLLDQRASTAVPETKLAVPPKEPDSRIRIAISVQPGARVEVGVQRLAQFLTTRTGIEMEAMAVDDRGELLGLLHRNDVDVVLLNMPEYLWLRDDEGVPLAPALYVSPVFAGLVVVRADGDIQSVDDLPGHAVAFSSWDAPAGLLGRAALIDRGLDVARECEVLYVAPSDVPEADEEALALLNDGDVAAVVLSNLALDRLKARAPALADRLRVLVESQPTSVGVVAARPDVPPDQFSALRAAWLELEPESLRTTMPFGRAIAVDAPLADNMADALRKVDVSSRQWLEGRPPEPLGSPDRPSDPSTLSEIRVALVPAAGTSIETRFVAPIYESLQKASRDLRLEFVVRETPEGEPPGDVALGLIDQGYNVLVAVAWSDPGMLWEIAREHADVKFVHFWNPYQEPLPNLLGFMYQMDQAGFLAGALAGMATESGRVAAIGGVPIPIVEQLVTGFEQGVKYSCPECEIVITFTDSWTDLALGEQTGRQVVEEGADVVFNAAGGLGSAAIRVAAQQGAWVIGMDIDEYLSTFRSGTVPNVDRLLGSVILRADRQSYETLERLLGGVFEPGSLALGVAEGGFEFLASPESAHPRRLELEQSMQEIMDRLRRGEINPQRE
jgi:basic membrane lipoprotein Med (substrate-binding protein (PBP1-ABC) superfamily)/ABC-type phosphate/phosphonate transport system substrate-binding protein